MGILIKPMLCIDHSYGFFLMYLHVLTTKLNLRFYTFVKHVKQIKHNIIIKHMINTPLSILHVIVILILKFRTNTRSYTKVLCIYIALSMVVFMPFLIYQFKTRSVFAKMGFSSFILIIKLLCNH